VNTVVQAVLLWFDDNFFPILRLSNPRVAVALSDQTCAVYDVDCLTKVETLCGHKGPVVNIRYSKYWKID
jgi:hypothetical protein